MALACNQRGCEGCSDPPCEHFAQRCDCGGKSFSFDRSLCACGSMHNYCDDCGTADGCSLDAAASAPNGIRNEPGAANSPPKFRLAETIRGIVRDEIENRCKCFPANDTCPSAARCKVSINESSGHVTLESGMVRSDDQGKPDYTLLDLDMLERLAVHMTKNVASKGHNNWRKASTEEDLQRFLASFWRHTIAFLRGDTDEDHFAALVFNATGAEHVRSQL